MPSPSELRGRRFGKLTVLNKAPRNGRDACWHVRCDCGALEVVAQHRLVRAVDNIDCCSQCRTIPCKICGAPVRIVRGLRRTCSDACKAESKRRAERERPSRRPEDAASIAALNEARRLRRQDPIKGENIRAADRDWLARRRTDEAFAKEKAAYKAQWYAKNRAAILDKRRAKKNERSDEQIRADTEKDREYTVRYRTKAAAIRTASEDEMRVYLEKRAEERKRRIFYKMLSDAAEIKNE